MVNFQPDCLNSYTVFEGHEEIVKFLLEVCKVQPLPEDRWQQTPLEEATRFGHYRLAAYIKNYVQEHPEQLQAKS